MSFQENWNIRLTPDHGTWNYVEAGNERDRVFVLVGFEDAQRQRRMKGERVGANVAAGSVSRGPVPHNYLAREIAILWYAYASAPYLDLMTNRFAEPPVLPLGQGRDLHKWGFLQPISIQRTSLPPFLPVELTFIHDGATRHWQRPYFSSFVKVSYRACFKPQVPRFFIQRLTQPGDVVYDPFMGRGTTPVEAALHGRIPWGNDLNPLSLVFTAPRRDVIELILKKSKQLLGDVTPLVRQTLTRVSPHAWLLKMHAEATPQIPSDSVSLVVTSPPFLDVVNYAEDNWLRCWFAGIDAKSVTLTTPARLDAWAITMTGVFRELHRAVKPGGHVAFEVGEVHGGKTKLEETALPCGVAAGFELVLVLINDQEFTKTANCWGVKNNHKGTNTNRVVVFRKAQ